MSFRRLVLTALHVGLGGVLVIAALAGAEIPKKINYQGRLTDSETGQPVPGTHTMTFRIYSVESGGTALWTESQYVNADSRGVVSAILGTDTPIDVAFTGSMWLEVEVGGGVLAPRREIVSVPFAFYAADAGHATNADSLGGEAADSYSQTGHDHDDRYYREAELNIGGTLNSPDNPVDWTRLKNVPADFADGEDDIGGAGDGHSLDAADGDPVDVVFVDHSGEVGIGTEFPASGLEIVGSTDLGCEIRSRREGAVTARFGSRASVGAVGTYTSNPFILETASSERMRIAANGNVGIGTQDPTELLDIFGNLKIIYEKGVIFGDDDTKLFRGGDDLYAWATEDVNIQPARNLFVGTPSGNYFAFDVVKKRLGIGTISPSQALEVVGNAVIAGFGGSPLKLSSTGQSYIEFENPGIGPMGIMLKNSYRRWFLTNGESMQDRFSLVDATAGKYVISIDGPRSNVGIWTSSPDTGSVLHVDAFGRTTGIRVENSAYYGVYAKFPGNYGGAAVLALNEGSEGSAIVAYAPGTCRSALHARGSLGVDYAVYGQADGADYAGYFDGIVKMSDEGMANNRVLDVQDVEYGTAIQTANIEMIAAPGASHDVLQLKAPSGSPDDFQFIECEIGGISTDFKFRVNGNGDVKADGTFMPGGADLAEMVAVSSGAVGVEPGDVMVIDHAEMRSIRKASEPRSTLVAGIYSTKPGFIGSEREWDKPAGAGEEGGGYTLLEIATEFNEIPMAVVGIVPCKVSAENGPISPGDLLVTSATPGHAMREDDPRVGTVLGKALEPLDSGTGLIKVLVTLQ